MQVERTAPTLKSQRGTLWASRKQVTEYAVLHPTPQKVRQRGFEAEVYFYNLDALWGNLRDNFETSKKIRQTALHALPKVLEHPDAEEKTTTYLSDHISKKILNCLYFVYFIFCVTHLCLAPRR